MHGNRKASFPVALATTLLLDVALTHSLCAASLTVPAGTLAGSKSGNDLTLSFPTISPNLYTIQTSPDLVQPWTSFTSPISGDGTVKTVTIASAFSGDKGFYRLMVQTPMKLLLPQSLAFAILGHSCGGIKEQSYVTGFDADTGFPIGAVSLSTTCSTGGRGSRPATFTAWAAVTWDFAGNVLSSIALSNAISINPALVATDGFGDTIYNAGTWAYLAVPIPAAPTSISAVQSGDQFEISWVPTGVNRDAITSSILSATPVNSTAPILTTTVTGSVMQGAISSLQPQTTYQITVVNTTISGYSPASSPISETTVPASIPASAPTGVTAHWTNPDPPGTTDSIIANWQTAVPGDSPIDQYRITITGSDGAGTFTQTVSGATLTSTFTVDYVPNWSVTIQAHNAMGWGPASTAVTLGGL